MLRILVRDKSSTAAAVLALAVLHVVGTAGCSRTNQFTAKTIPVGLQAPPVTNAQTVDLSRFAGPPVSNEMIHHGDLLRVSLAAGLEADQVTTFFIRVGDDGMGQLPDIGQVLLAGLHLMDAEQQIAAACRQRDLYRRPHVTVAMARKRVNSVTVVGGVENPGVYEIPRSSSYLAAAIVAAGGLAEDAGTWVEIRRPAAWAGPHASGVQLASNMVAAAERPTEVVCLNLSDIAAQAHRGEFLEDGTVVTVEKRMPDPIQVVGLVNAPGQYDFPVNHELRLFGAIAQAGGLSSSLADAVIVIRRTADGEQSAVIKLSISAAKWDHAENLRLAPGDIVSVEQTPLTIVSDVISRMVRFAIGGSVGFF